GSTFGTPSSITVAVKGDTRIESNETFFVNLSNPTGTAVFIAKAPGIGTIQNDDSLQPSVLSISDLVSVIEGNTGTTTNAVFTVTLSPPSPQLVTVAFTTSDALAKAGSDYVPTNGVLTFAASETTKTISVSVIGDNLVEGDENFLVTLSNLQGATIIDGGQALGVIKDDDVPANSAPTVMITSPTNGAAFNQPANVTITAFANDPDGSIARVEFFQGTNRLGESIASPYSFAWSGIAAGNYTLTAKATDNLGATTNSVPISILVNARPNTPIITSPASGATFNEPANIIITVDANDPGGSIAKVEFFQGDIKLGETSAAPYSFIWSNVAAGNYTLTAIATDNLGATSISTSVDIVVKQTGNLLPALSISDDAVTEGNGETVNVVFHVSLSASNSLPVTVNYATASDTALAGSDFVATNGTLIFAPGETNKTISVLVKGDTIAEETESFFVNLSNPTNATISDDQGLGFITDDDSLPTIVITDTAVTEGDSGTINAVFNVSLSAISGQIVAIDFATADDTAKAGSDYQAVNGTLTFNPGETNKTIVVRVIGDLIGEPDESFFVNLNNVVNAVLTDSQARGRITDNDSFPRFSISDATVTEGNSGIASAIFTVSLSSASLQTITVDYATTNDTAIAGSDYTAVSGTLSFSPGQTSGTITVPVLGDTLAELDETFLVNLSRAVNAGITVGQGVGTIVDDDQPPSLLITDAVVSEGIGGTTTRLVFQVRLSTASGKTVSVNYTTANGTATAGSDYQPANGTLTFPSGTNVQTVTVTVTGDDLVEPDETVLVNLSNGVNATIGRGQGVGKILNDEQLPSLTVTDASVTEGDSGITNEVFTLLLSIASIQTVTVDFITGDGTATAGSDYIVVSRTITFPPGTTTTNVSVQVIGDTIQEPDEVFIVRLTNAVNATIARGQGQGAIRDDDNSNTPKQPVLGITLTLDRLPVIQLQGQVGTSYLVEASTNLVNWITFTNVIATDTLMRFPETGALKFRARYYRASQGP
ncbi:MAG: Calx-beta domain-containing protein, partial [Verrucomicrobiota bacterium]